VLIIFSFFRASIRKIELIVLDTECSFMPSVLALLHKKPFWFIEKLLEEVGRQIDLQDLPPQMN